MGETTPKEQLLKALAVSFACTAENPAGYSHWKREDGLQVAVWEKTDARIYGDFAQVNALLSPSPSLEEIRNAVLRQTQSYGVSGDPGIVSVPEEHLPIYAQGLWDAFHAVLYELTRISADQQEKQTTQPAPIVITEPANAAAYSFDYCICNACGSHVHAGETCKCGVMSVTADGRTVHFRNTAAAPCPVTINCTTKEGT